MAHDGNKIVTLKLRSDQVEFIFNGLRDLARYCALDKEYPGGWGAQCAAQNRGMADELERQFYAELKG